MYLKYKFIFTYQDTTMGQMNYIEVQIIVINTELLPLCIICISPATNRDLFLSNLEKYRKNTKLHNQSLRNYCRHKFKNSKQKNWYDNKYCHYQSVNIPIEIAYALSNKC